VYWLGEGDKEELRARNGDSPMHRLIKRAVRWGFAAAGWEVRRAPDLYESIPLGLEPLHDMLRLSRSSDKSQRPVVFDVGANVGNFVHHFRETFSKPIIHAFEPDSRAFRELQANTAGISDITLNVGLGSQKGQLTFLVSNESPMSSFLEPERSLWSKIARRVEVPVRTIDDYCREKQIHKIDILKIDTQGYDLEVMRGGESMMRAGRIQLLYTEICFSKLYKGQAGLDPIYKYLCDCGFRLVAFYRFSYLRNLAGWTDALFAYAGDLL
jgi:FkbM family methyltransferase